MEQKQSGPRCIGGSGGPGGDEDGRKASSPQKIAHLAPKRPAPRKVWWLRKFHLRAEAVDFLWPGSIRVLGGSEGDHAVVTQCRRDRGPGQVRVSLHRTRKRAEEIKAKLDAYGCDPLHFRCPGEHEIVDLSTGFDELSEHLHAVRAAWRGKP